jgi:hypothetical protein
VLSGGGARGAFTAGAVYHLVVDRQCDFSDISGVSVGALNGAVLAQAAMSDDPQESLRNLGKQAHELVAVWESIKGTQDIFKKRFLGMLRLGLLKAESVNDFGPLQKLIQTHVSPHKLLSGRTVRVGVVSFWDGKYREIVASKVSEQENQTFLKYILASASIPISGRMPQIQDDPSITDEKQWTQFADAGLRRVTPLGSYFRTCAHPENPTADQSGSGSLFIAPCYNSPTNQIPAHEGPINQIFVIVSTPYSRGSDAAELPNPACCREGTRRFTNGHKILQRMISLTVGIPYRWDLDFGQFANDILRWRQEQYHALEHATGVANVARIQEGSQHLNSDFPVESYNTDVSSELPSLPYEISIVAAQKVFADVYGLDPVNIREQLYCGCMAADRMMANGDSKQSMSSNCAQRFPRFHRLNEQPAGWDEGVCWLAPEAKETSKNVQ